MIESFWLVVTRTDVVGFFVGLHGLSTPAWSGLSAIGGALVGGTVTGVATYVQEGRRQAFERDERKIEREREDEERRAIARGTARVMRTRYHRLASIIEASLNNDMWLPTGIEIEAAPSIDDRKLVAALASPDEWLSVDVAEFNLGLMLAARDSAVAERGSPTSPGGHLSGLSVTDSDRTNITRTIAGLSKAKDALGRIAETSD